MATDDGTWFFVIRFPSPWPVRSRTLLVSRTDVTGPLSLHAEPFGGLTLSMTRETRGPHAWTSQAIELRGNGYAIVTALWSETETGLNINGVDLLAKNSAEAATPVVVTQEHPRDPTPSWDRPEAHEHCSSWRLWRHARFVELNSAPRQGRRAKTLSEQLEELRNSIRTLDDLATLVSRNHTHLVGHLAVEIRALVFWHGRQYDPLLLRLAASRDLPLPLFVLRDVPLPQISIRPSAHIRFGEPAIQRSFPSHVLVDLQDWLSQLVVTEDATTIGTPTDIREASVMSTIAAVADTLGAAHYDRDTLTTLDVMRSFYFQDISSVVSLLLRTVEVLIPLSEYVIDRTSSEERPLTMRQT